MVGHEIVCDAISHAMTEFRASGPCTEDQIRHAIFTQTVGVDAANVDETTDRVMEILKTRRVIERYDADSWDVRVRTPKVAAARR